MIPSLLALALCAAPGGASTVATSSAAPGGAQEGLQRFRLPFERLVEDTIGSTSRPVRFHWRDTVQIAALAAQPAELNNFDTFRAGALVRFPTDAVMLELGLGYAWVFDTESSRQLARTPYRQPGRPPRLELDFTVGYPLAEGVVTAWPSFFPAVELVFNAYGSFRYLLYPTGFSGIGAGSALAALVRPALTDEEIASLEGARRPGMAVDPQRYYFMAGLGLDVYFASGFFVSPRIMLNVPLMAAVTGSDMIMGYDFAIALGYAF